MQAVTDEQLIQWVAQGDASCLGTLFERHHRSVFRYCLQMTGDRPTSEDLVQETFMRLLTRAAGYRGEGSFKAWMFTIARNAALDAARRSQRQSALSAPLAEDALIDTRSAERAAAGDESARHLLRALATLPAAVREVIWLGRFEFRSYAELGAALECSEGNARVRMHRAMKQLHEALATINGRPTHD